MNAKPITFVFISFILAAAVCAGERDYWPTEAWRTADPQTHGVDPNALNHLLEYLGELKTDAFLAVRHGYIVKQWYGSDFSKDDVHDSYSMAKSFCNAAVGLAIQDKTIKGIHQNVSEFYPEYSHDPNSYFNDVTIEHLLSMTSGIDYDNRIHYPQMQESNDWAGYVLSRPVIHRPGTMWKYKADPMVLSGIISRVTGQSMFDYLNARVFQVIGIHSARWKSDPTGQSSGNGDLFAKAEDYARFGFLYLNNGCWDGKRILDPDWIRASTAPCRSKQRVFCNCWDNNSVCVSADQPLEYGYLWWCRKIPGVPDDMYYAFGGLGQFFLIIPSLDMVVVRLGQDRCHADIEILPKMLQLIVKAVERKS